MASTKTVIRKALVGVLQSGEATFEERIKAARMLMKLLGLAKPCPHGCRGAKANVQERSESKNTLDDLLSKIDPD